MQSRISFYKEKLNLFSIKIDDYDNYKNYETQHILTNMQFSIKNYEVFINNYMKSNDDELSADKIIRILKAYE